MWVPCHHPPTHQLLEDRLSTSSDLRKQAGQDDCERWHYYLAAPPIIERCPGHHVITHLPRGWAPLVIGPAEGTAQHNQRVGGGVQFMRQGGPQTRCFVHSILAQAWPGSPGVGLAFHSPRSLTTSLSYQRTHRDSENRYEMYVCSTFYIKSRFLGSPVFAFIWITAIWPFPSNHRYGPNLERF